MAERNYRKEYDEYHGTERQKKRRSARNKARRYMQKNGRVSKGDSKEVDHKNYNTEDNRPSNLRVVDKKTNREKQPKRG
jgi:hypothetical protein|tara:strand:+ start:174 stop:410 length:237 start_codon:yes stop_codon:yes gene_type:complete